jgi:hypothetical protein
VTSYDPFASAFGVCQDGIVQFAPVKLLTPKTLRSHLRQGFPDRSNARSLSLIAPAFALGPSLEFDIGTGPPNGPVVSSLRVGQFVLGKNDNAQIAGD